MHHCPYCQQGYTRKTYFDRHVLICAILCKSKKEQKLEEEEIQDTPTLRNLYKVVKELVVKNKQLEEKVQEMSTYINAKKQKMNVTEWLNVTYNQATDYLTWFSEIQVKQSHLQILFDSDYANGVTSVLKQLLQDEDARRPLRAFNTKENAFYFYSENKWLLMDNESYLKLMHVLDKKMMNEFVLWQRENKEKFYADELSDKFYAYTNKMMATREPLYSRIKKNLYSYLKEGVPQMSFT